MQYACNHGGANMKMLVLGKSMTEHQLGGKYFGTYRIEPTYIEEAGPTSSVNELWRWYVNQIGDGGALSESHLEKARELIREYAKLGKDFQLIELAPDAHALCVGRFIGFDVSLHSGYSPLSWGLTFHPRTAEHFNRGLPKPITLLIERYFQPKLNEYGLFQEFETATFLLDVIRALDEFSPGWFESYLDEFEVVAVGIIEGAV